MTASASPAVQLRELLDDAEKRPDRLTAWEREFMASMRRNLERDLRDVTLSPRQAEVLRIIERKVYAVG